MIGAVNDDRCSRCQPMCDIHDVAVGRSQMNGLHVDPFVGSDDIYVIAGCSALSGCARNGDLSVQRIDKKTDVHELAGKKLEITVVEECS